MFHQFAVHSQILLPNNEQYGLSDTNGQQDSLANIPRFSFANQGIGMFAMSPFLFLPGILFLEWLANQ